MGGEGDFLGAGADGAPLGECEGGCVGLTLGDGDGDATRGEGAVWDGIEETGEAGPDAGGAEAGALAGAGEAFALAGAGDDATGFGLVAGGERGSGGGADTDGGALDAEAFGGGAFEGASTRGEAFGAAGDAFGGATDEVGLPTTTAARAQFVTSREINRSNVSGRHSLSCFSILPCFNAIISSTLYSISWALQFAQ